MNAKQNSKFKMYGATEKHCDDNTEITKDMPAFVTAFNNFKTKINEINATTRQKNEVLTGIATDKNSPSRKDRPWRATHARDVRLDRRQHLSR